MTVGEMRELMRRRVVPEEIVPQNVVNLLMDDEDSAPPELDAFSFLTRLRSLGIGSADFVYLMEGCGAPRAVVDRIKNNPAMNLQGLILTLENSELTADDYSRILYTARQIWERTLTLRLRKSETASQGGDEREDYSEPSFEELMDELDRPVDDEDVISDHAEFREAFVTEELEPVSANEPLSERASENDTEYAAPGDVSDSDIGYATEEVFGSDTEYATAPENVPEGDDGYAPAPENVFGSDTEYATASENVPDGDDGYAPAPEDVFGSDNGYAPEIVPDGGAEYAAPEDEFDSGTGYMPAPEVTSGNDTEYEPAFEDEPVYEDDFEVGEPEEPEEPEDDPADAYADFAEYGSEPPHTVEIEPVQPRPYNGDTTAIIKIDADMLRKNLAQLADESEAVRTEAMRLAAERAQREAREAYEAARAEEAAVKATARPAETEDDEELDGLYGQAEPEAEDDNGDGGFADDEPARPVKTAKTAKTVGPAKSPKRPDAFVVRVPREHRYHKGALAAAAAGAAAVFGAAVAVPLIPEPAVVKSIGYAEDNAEIFGEIYRAYYAGSAGGAKAHERAFDYTEIFGDLLVNAEGYGTFSGGDSVYTVSADAIAVYSFRNGELTPLDDILPPDGTKIVDAFDDKGELVTVFSGGNECGFMRVSDGRALFTVRQDGFMTDLARTDGGIAIGSVYTPIFTRTFGVTDAMVYMPRLGVGEKKALEPQKVVASGTVGYSYGISAAYSTANGSASSAVAVLGDPISASSDGRFIMSGEEDLLITVGEEIAAVKAAGIQAAAFCGNGSATLEGGNINLRDRDGNVLAALVNPSQPVTSLWFEGDMLRLCGSGGVFDTRDCSDLANAKPAALKSVNGAVVGENAVVFDTGANSFTVTEYKRENGSASVANTFTKTLQPEYLATLQFGGINTVIADGVRFGAAYRYFDGVSIMSGFAMMEENGQVCPVEELYDDRTGYTLAFKHGGSVYAQCEKGIVDILN